MTSEWRPSVEVTRFGQESYIDYLGGLALVHTPDSTFSQHLLGQSSREPEAILAHAERVMVSGLRGVIWAANPPEPRGGLVQAEGNYSVALPHMQYTIKSAFDTHGKRIDTINDMFFTLQPTPVLSGTVYKHLCHGRGNLLLTTMLLGAYPPAGVFEALVAGRHVPLEDMRRYKHNHSTT